MILPRKIGGWMMDKPQYLFNKIWLLPVCCLVLIASSGCSNKKDVHADHNTASTGAIYTCPMHPEIIRNQAGQCPICGMDLVKKETGGMKSAGDDIDALLRPTNEFVLSSVPVTTMKMNEEQMEITALGNVAYDTRDVGSISSRVAGRIEKLYIRYRYQKISKGQRILDIYSPELMTAQQNLLFLLKNDRDNTTFIRAAKDRLLLLGMSAAQLQQVIRLGKPALSIAVYSNYSGHVHESFSVTSMSNIDRGIEDISLLTAELSLREGMYLQKGQSVFTVFNPARAWVVLNIYGEGQALIKKANAVLITPETAPDKSFRATISFIEPFYRKESKTLTARVYFNNSVLKLPIGSQVRATIYGNSKEAWWLPNTAVVSLGLDKIVFQKTGNGFKPRKINAGILYKNKIQVWGDLSPLDSFAVNAEYLMDSESFIKVNN